MKNILVFLILCSSLSYGQDLKLFFPELDAQLIHLWQQNESKVSLYQRVNYLDAIWKDVKPQVCDNLYNFPEESIYCIEELLLLIRVNAERNRIDLIKPQALDLLKELRALRERTVSYQYPLDVLVYTYETIAEIDYTVHDLLFGLREWFEFNDLLNNLNRDWKTYRAYSFSDLVFYNSGLEKESHEAACVKFELCQAVFMSSLESGYQSDFMLPCNEMKLAIEELFMQYTRYEKQYYYNEGYESKI